MEKIVFAMPLKRSVAAEYEKRLDALWPDLGAALEAAGSAPTAF